MASKPHKLSAAERSEIAAAIGPLAERFAHRFGVSFVAVLFAAKSAVYERPAPSLPANYAPANPVMARLVTAAHKATDLTPAAVIEDDFAAAQAARDAVIYAARSDAGLSFDTIGTALGDKPYEIVMDGYCRAIGRLENDDKDFARLVFVLTNALRRRA